MAKLTAWLVTLLGLLLVLAALGLFKLTYPWFIGLLGLAVLVIGVGKLVRNYSKRKR